MFKRSERNVQKEETPEEIAEDKRARARVVKLLRGFKDTLPKDAPYWEWLRTVATSLSHAHGYERIDVPHVEDMRLFVRAVGKETDIVQKELFSFPDRDGVQVALRPEFTASIVRAYVEHGFLSLPQPVRMFTMGSLFRYERPQSGRFREHSQWDVEVIGDTHPVLDAEVILLAVRFFQTLGIDAAVSINSLGCATCRPPYREAFVQHARKHKRVICEHCQRRLTRNPLRMLDCKETQCAVVREGAPQLVDWLCEGCKSHFIKVLEYCDALRIPYELSPYLVRGFDYYTKTVFECYTTRPSAEGERHIALAGGGRYDDLVALLGGRPTPAVGFGVGLERVIGELKAREIVPPAVTNTDVFVAQLGDAGREKALALAEELRKERFTVRASFSKDGLKAQLELANKLGAAVTVIIGQKEVLDHTVMMREMDGGNQEVVPMEKVVSVLQKKLRDRLREPTPIVPTTETAETSVITQTEI